jgi:hypothetical protein
MCDDLQRIQKTVCARVSHAFLALPAANADHISMLFFRATVPVEHFTPTPIIPLISLIKQPCSTLAHCANSCLPNGCQQRSEKEDRHPRSHALHFVSLAARVTHQTLEYCFRKAVYGHGEPSDVSDIAMRNEDRDSD